MLVALSAVVVAASPPTAQLKVIGSAWILAPAVAQTESGLVGSATNISVFVTEGWGDVYVSTYSLTQEDFQGAATAAARVVTRLLGLNFSQYNYYFKVQGDAVIVGGPSAGVAMAVAVYSALTGKPINRTVFVTGMISPDGTVGPVGGVFEKAQAVAQAGAKVFLVPPGQSIVTQYQTVERKIGPFRLYTTQPVTVNLTEYAYKNWHLRVVEISTLSEALRYFFGVSVARPPLGKPYLSADTREKIASVKSSLTSLARKELGEAYSYVNSSRLTQLGKSTLKSYLDRYAKSYLDSATRAEGISSIPLLTSSIAVSRWIKLLVDYYSGLQLDQQVQEVSDRLSRLAGAVEDSAPRSIGEINALILATDKVIHALKLFNESAAAWSSDPATALQKLAYSSALLDEAENWLSGIPRGGGIQASQAAATYLSVARSTWPYIYSVLSEAGGDLTLIDAASAYYQISARLYSSRKPLLAAVAAARSVALAEAAMLYFQVQASGKDPYSGVSLENALSVASATSDMLVTVYYINQSYGAELRDSLAYLKLGSQLGQLTLDLARVKPGQPAETQKTPSAPTQPEQPPQKPSQPGKSLTDWLQEILLRISLFIESIVDWFRRLLGK